MNISFRRAVLSDIKDLNQISAESKQYWGYPDEWMENWIDELTLSEENIGDQIVIVAEIEEEIIGFCSIIDGTEYYEVIHLWVLPKYIGKGYGKQLLDKTIEESVSQNKPIIVEADPNAERFYEKQGFVTFDKVESFPKGRFLPIMKKNTKYSLFD